jgi:hypothetical protein
MKIYVEKNKRKKSNTSRKKEIKKELKTRKKQVIITITLRKISIYSLFKRLLNNPSH